MLLPSLTLPCNLNKLSTSIIPISNEIMSRPLFGCVIQSFLSLIPNATDEKKTTVTSPFPNLTTTSRVFQMKVRSSHQRWSTWTPWARRRVSWVGPCGPSTRRTQSSNEPTAPASDHSKWASIESTRAKKRTASRARLYDIHGCGHAWLRIRVAADTRDCSCVWLRIRLVAYSSSKHQAVFGSMCEHAHTLLLWSSIVWYARPHTYILLYQCYRNSNLACNILIMCMGTGGKLAAAIRDIIVGCIDCNLTFLSGLFPLSK